MSRPILMSYFVVGFRVQEEIGGLKKKLEKYKSREWMNSSDEVLLEEIKTYKVT